MEFKIQNKKFNIQDSSMKLPLKWNSKLKIQYSRFKYEVAFEMEFSAVVTDRCGPTPREGAAIAVPYSGVYIQSGLSLGLGLGLGSSLG